MTSRKILLLGSLIALLCSAVPAFAKSERIVCFLNTFSPTGENTSTGGKPPLKKVEEIPSRGDFLFKNQGEQFSYAATFNDGKLTSLILRDEGEGLNAASRFPGNSLGKDDYVSAGFRTDLTKMPGEKIRVTNVECMREARFLDLEARPLNGKT